MTKITVDLSDKVVDQATKKHIKQLEAQVKRLKNCNQKLVGKIRAQKFKVEEAERIVSIASDITSEFGDKWDD